MIRTFKCRQTEQLFNGQRVAKLPADIQRRAFYKLTMLNTSEKIEDLRVPPSNRLEKLIGNRANQYSIRINDKYRICFYWQDNEVWDVEIVDYR